MPSPIGFCGSSPAHSGGGGPVEPGGGGGGNCGGSGGCGSGGLRSSATKLATTCTSCESVSWHDSVPAHAPPQLSHRWPAAAVAITTAVVRESQLARPAA